MNVEQDGHSLSTNKCRYWEMSAIMRSCHQAVEVWTLTLAGIGGRIKQKSPLRLLFVKHYSDYYLPFG